MSRSHTRRSSVALAGALLLATGCTPWSVIRESGPPSALKGAPRIEVSFDYSQASLGGMSEAAWIARQPPDEQAAYAEVKRNMDEAFLAALARTAGVSVIPVAPGVPPSQEAAQLIVRYTFIEQGKYAVFFRMNSEVQAILAWGRSGQITDEIQIQRTVEAELSRPAIIQRMRVATDQLGELGAKFFRQAQET
jgi:hypothetical protein